MCYVPLPVATYKWLPRIARCGGGGDTDGALTYFAM